MAGAFCCPTALQLYEVIESPETDEVYVMMELCEGGPVYAAGDAPISEDMCRKYMLCVMEGMAYLHGLHVGTVLIPSILAVLVWNIPWPLDYNCCHSALRYQERQHSPHSGQERLQDR